MANHAGGRGPNWTPEEDAVLLDLAAQKVPHMQIAKRLPGRTGAGVYGRLRALRTAASFGREPGDNNRPFETPKRVRTDDAKHLRAVLMQGGFCWLKDASAETFYALEWAPQGNPWWRVA